MSKQLDKSRMSYAHPSYPSEAYSASVPLSFFHTAFISAHATYLVFPDFPKNYLDTFFQSCVTKPYSNT